MVVAREYLFLTQTEYVSTQQLSKIKRGPWEWTLVELGDLLQPVLALWSSRRPLCRCSPVNE